MYVRQAANVHMEAPRATKIPVTVVMNSDHGRIGGHRVLLIVLVIGMDVLIARAGIWLILMRRRRLMRHIIARCHVRLHTW